MKSSSPRSNHIPALSLVSFLALGKLLSLSEHVFSSVKEYYSGHPLFIPVQHPVLFLLSTQVLLSHSPVVSNMVEGSGVFLKLASHLLSGNESSVGRPKN